MKKKYLILTLCVLATSLTACAGTDLSNKNTSVYIEEETTERTDHSQISTNIEKNESKTSSENKNLSDKTENSKNNEEVQNVKDNNLIQQEINQNNKEPSNEINNQTTVETTNNSTNKVSEDSNNNESTENNKISETTESSSQNNDNKSTENSENNKIEITYTPLNEVEDNIIYDVFCNVGSVLDENYLPKMTLYQQEIEHSYGIPKNSIEYAYGEVPFLPTDVDFLIGIKTMDGNEELVENAIKEYIKLLQNDSGQTNENLAKYKTIQVYRNDCYIFIIGTFGNTSDITNTDKIIEISRQNIDKALKTIENVF